MKRYSLILLTILFLGPLIFAGPLPGAAQEGGATLFLSPGSGTYTVGKSFTIKVMVDSGGGVGINAAEGVINYDTDLITVTRLSDANSIFSLWTSDPAFSNNDGKVTFGGGAPGAYKGSAGEIFSITFSAKNAGTADATWSSGIVLAADGKGTNVFGGFGNGQYTLETPGESDEPDVAPPPRREEREEEVKGILPPLPEVNSATHPEDGVWYADNDPEFSWKILSDLTGLSYDITGEPEGSPDNVSEGVVEFQTFQDQPDGEWYFHLKFQNRYGWGQTAHKPFKVDVTPPRAFTVDVDDGGDSTNPTPKLIFSTRDEASGISHYMYLEGLSQERISPSEVENGYYRTPLLAPGEYTVEIAAYDYADNSASSTVRFVVDPLKAPIITSIPQVLNRKEELIIRGTSFYPQVTVKIFISGEDNETIEAAVTTDEAGNWSYFHKDKLNKGNYEVWAKIIDDRGAQSLDSTKHLLTVVPVSILESFGWLIIIILLLIIAGLSMYIVYMRQRYAEERARIYSETLEVKNKLGRIFQALREEVDELIEMADTKAGLSESERRVKEKLQESLDISEEFIGKEVEDVEKEINMKKKEEK